MNKLDVMTSGSEYQFADKIQQPQFPSSAFDLSHTLTMAFPVGSVGALIPLCVLETVPSDRFSISVNHLLRVLPQVVPLYSQMKIYIHAFYSRSSDLWKTAEIYYRKGNNGNRVLKKPVLDSSNCYLLSTDYLITSDNLLHWLYGVPIGIMSSTLRGKLNALPYFMLFKVWRDYFCNRYYYENDTKLLPDDKADFRINDDGIVVSYNSTEWQTDAGNLPINQTTGFFYRDYADDRFTASMPSPQRGDAPVIQTNTFLQGYYVGNGAAEKIGDYMRKFSNYSVDNVQMQEGWTSGTNSNAFLYSEGVFNHTRSQNVNNLHNWDSNVPPRNPGSSTIKFRQDFSITLNDIRQLAINQTELEKMARTDGSYREFGLTFFGVASKTSVDYCPQYIGGTWQPIVFTEVVQTSGTAQGAGVLGQYAGHGISSNNGNLGSVYCDDFGYIMILASIVPETLYSQGLDKQFTRLYQAEELLPERAKLGAQPVLTKELYFTGTGTDEELFAYQDIFDEFRYRPSRVAGVLSAPNSNANPFGNTYFPYTQSRYFQAKPVYSQGFATTKNNVRMDFLTSQNDPPFTAQFRFNIRATRPLPYKAVPASII